MSEQEDIINEPKHYISESGLECIDVIQAFNLNFNLGNVIKYVLRAGKKGDKEEDLRKAMKYLEFELDPNRQLCFMKELHAEEKE